MRATVRIANSRGAGRGQRVARSGPVLPSPGDLTFADVASFFHVVSAFEVPRCTYSAQRKAFESAMDKPTLFRERFELLRHRLLRNELFRADSAFHNPNNLDDEESFFKITGIKHLLTKESGSFFAFGMLTRMQDGRYHLEDPYAHIPLEFPRGLAQTPGLFTENCFVVVEGTLTSRQTLRLAAIGMPASEPRAVSELEAYDFVGFWAASILGMVGVFTPSPVQDSLLDLERSLEDVFFVVLSDVWLDQPKVLLKLRSMLEGFCSSSSILPLAFIFAGNFSSSPYLLNGHRTTAYRDGFNNLADIISEFPRLRESRFVFVPGPGDPWTSDVMPREAIPTYFTERVRQKVPHAIFATNPCRIKFFTQELVVFREDLVNKLRRNCIIAPNEDDEPDPTKHLIRTVIEQAHLCPLPLEVRPVLWDHDSAMRLYPAPHALILADRFDQYVRDYMDCKCANPGSFPNSDWTFLVYQAATREYQVSKVP
ncbi:DNA polymerase alpha/epsilon subunit B-domain-containing protein [Hyaloraphidium curvatum]|nr:DNA polymerase alpha/epsilon subunit B-domain-containing protein [Hyaloraphidium curvatum]